MIQVENSTVRFENFIDFKYLNEVFQFLFLHSLAVLPSTMRIYSDTTIPVDIQALGQNEVTRYRLACIDSQVTVNPSPNVKIHCTSVLSDGHIHKKVRNPFAEVMVDSLYYYPYFTAALTKIFEFGNGANIKNIVINTTSLQHLESLHREFQGEVTNDQSEFSSQYILAQYPNGIIPLPDNKFYVITGKMTDKPYQQQGSIAPARIIHQSVNLYNGLDLLQLDHWSAFGYSRDGRGTKWEDAWDDFIRLDIKNKFVPVETFELYSLPVSLK